MALKPKWNQSQILPKKIESIDYCILSPNDTLKNSVTSVNRTELYNEQKQTVANGPLDLRMGMGRESGQNGEKIFCATCHLDLANCVGHFGHLHLSVPIFHIGYFKHLIIILKMVCKSCSHVMLDPEEARRWKAKLTAMERNYPHRQALFRKMMKQVAKNRECPRCGMTNPVIQKVPKVAAKMEVRHPTMKADIIHSRVKRQAEGSVERSKEDFRYEINPWQALQVISRIPRDEWILLNVAGDTQISHFIVQDLPVPPVCIRPSLSLSTSDLSNEDDLTINIKLLLRQNKELQNTMLSKGDQIHKINKKWYLLQSYWNQYINNDTPGLPLNELKHNKIKSLCNRLKGKQGRFRQNLSGKRSNFTARTVISPDPNLHINEVIVPQFMSKIVTISETVNNYNIKNLAEVVEEKKANFHIDHNGYKTALLGRVQKKIHLNVGDTVERHLRDGDIVIFNRQPSLHRLSMMGFKVKIAPGKTLRFNECVCAPFNADFDGDEMNIHVPQTYEARAETLHLMGSHENIISPKSGDPIIALIQDFLTTSYLITSRERFFTRLQFTQLLSYITDGQELIEIPRPTIFKPVELWTGKQVISSLIQPNTKTKVVVNLQAKEKVYSKDEVMCIRDGWVLFHNSELLSGRLGKATLGGNKTGLIYALLRDNSNKLACQVMHRIAKLSSRWLSNFGMTFGLSDVTPSAELSENYKQVIRTSQTTYNEYLQLERQNKLEAKPGMTVQATLESHLNKTLSDVRDTVGNQCIEQLDPHNMPLVMAVCGSKGSHVNLSQMIGCLGQQTVGGKRISFGFTQRTLPHFPRKKESPAARGFVRNSFFTGLTPTEFFFHTMGGRQGIIDTAVKTAQTGYMQRRLIKHLEDVAVMYDRTVRSVDTRDIIQFRYGGDGINPIKAEQTTNPINLTNLQHHVKTQLALIPKKQYLTPKEIQQLSTKYIEGLMKKRILGEFKEEVDMLEKNLLKVSEYFAKKKIKLEKDYAQIKIKKKKDENYLKNCFNGMTKQEMDHFFKMYEEKLMKAIIEPGEPIGALTAQSIGEPATQMTLKTFHFAGISSMNITQGVPRVNQIINCTKNIATPIITIHVEGGTKEQALKVKHRVEKLPLSKLLREVTEIHNQQGSCLQLFLNMNKLKELSFSLEYLSDVIGRALKSKIKKISVEGQNIVIVPVVKTNVIFDIKALRRKVETVIVGGIGDISRALVSKEQKNNNYIIFAEGLGLGQVLQTEGVLVKKTFSNHIVEIFECLGIEAARKSIITQVTQTMKSHGVNVNERHIDMLAQVMTSRGKIIGFTRTGVDQLKDSTLMLASFEKTSDFLFDAATQGKHDRMRGISEKIICGQPITVGTGMFDIKQDIPTRVYATA